MARNPLLAQIHIARKELALDDDDYRALLERITGRRSASGMSDPDLLRVIGELKRLGFRPKGGRRKSDKSYVRLIFALWGQLKKDGIWRDPHPQSLRRWVEKMTGVGDPEWLGYAQATPVIEALKKMRERQQ